MREDNIKVIIEPQLRGDALGELEAKIKRVSGEMAHAGELAKNIKLEGIQQEMAAAESLLAEKRATLERMQAHSGGMPPGAGMMAPGMMGGGGGGGLDLGTMGMMIGGRMGGALNVVGLAKQTFDTAFHLAHAPADAANQIAQEKQAADMQSIQRTDAVLHAGKQADGGKEAAALAAGFHDQRKGLESQRGTVMDTGGAMDELKHASEAILGEGKWNSVGQWSKNWFGQDLTRTSGERAEEANDAEIADLKNHEKSATVLAQRMASKADQTKGSKANEQPQTQAQPDAKPEVKPAAKPEVKAAFAQMPGPARGYAQLVAARDGAADTARLATLAHQEAPRQADGGALERLRQDMNRNHAEATHAATRKTFARP